MISRETAKRQLWAGANFVDRIYCKRRKLGAKTKLMKNRAARGSSLVSVKSTYPPIDHFGTKLKERGEEEKGVAGLDTHLCGR